MTLLDIIFVIIFPPLAVAHRKGISKVFWINLILTILFYIPGLIHGTYIITKK